MKSARHEAVSSEISGDIPQGRVRQRSEQKRAIETRAAILNAAISEFAEKGFEIASIRNIAERTGIQHPRITYHYRTKDILWRAAAEHAFGRIKEDWDSATGEALPPLQRLRQEYHALFRYTVAFPEFHRFMRQEANSQNPRLEWVAENVVKPLLARLLPQIEAAQAAGLLPRIEPILFHYMMVSLTATLSEFGPEMALTGSVDPNDETIAKAYWNLVDRTVFADRDPA